jgi:hypothetical protein
MQYVYFTHWCNRQKSAWKFAMHVWHDVSLEITKESRNIDMQLSTNCAVNKKLPGKLQ